MHRNLAMLIPRLQRTCSLLSAVLLPTRPPHHPPLRHPSPLLSVPNAEALLLPLLVVYHPHHRLKQNLSRNRSLKRKRLRESGQRHCTIITVRCVLPSCCLVCVVWCNRVLRYRCVVWTVVPIPGSDGSGDQSRSADSGHGEVFCRLVRRLSSLYEPATLNHVSRWTGTVDGKSGLFPATYVKLL